MDACEALTQLNGDFTVLSAVLYGVSSADHNALSSALAGLVEAVLERRMVLTRAVAETEDGLTEASPSSLLFPSPASQAESPASLRASRKHDVATLFRVGADFLSLSIAMELRHALCTQRNAHVFMRGNGVVPLLWEALGSHFVQKLLTSRGDNSAGAAVDDILLELTELPSGDAPQPRIRAAVDMILSMPEDATAVDVADDVAEIDAFVHRLWASFEGTAPSWPLEMRWALSAIYKLTRTAQFAPASAEASSDDTVSSMLATIVVLRMMSPFIMRFPSERHPQLRTLDVFDATVSVARRRVTFVTKLLQKAAYQLPMLPNTTHATAASTALPSAATATATANSSAAVSYEAPAMSASSAVNGVVDRLSARIRAFWLTLCAPASLVQPMCDIIGSARSTLADSKSLLPDRDFVPVTEVSNGSFGSSHSSQRWATASSSSAMSPMSGSPFRAEELSAEARQLYELIDKHSTAILGHMNALRPLSAVVNLYRLVNFSHYCSRRLMPSDHFDDTMGSGISGMKSSRSLDHVSQNLEAELSTASETHARQPMPPTSESLSFFGSLKKKIMSKSSSTSDGSAPRTAPSSGHADNSSSAVTSSRLRADDALEEGKKMMFTELVAHSVRCVLQPETLNYSQSFGVIIGNVHTVASMKAREENFASQDDENPPPTLLVLYADQLTEAVGLFAQQRERNASVLGRCLKHTTKFCARVCPSLLDGALDAAAHLCMLLDIIAQARSSSRSLQILFFPPQDSLKCGCGKEWLKTILQHLVPRSIVGLIAQVVFVQPANVLHRRPSLGQHGVPWFQSDSNVLLAPAVASSTRDAEGVLRGVKTLSVSSGLEHVALGSVVGEGHFPAPLTFVPSVELIKKLKASPSLRRLSVPVTLRDWLILSAEVRHISTCLPSSSRSLGGKTPRSFAASSFPSDVGNVFTLQSGFEALDAADDVWQLSTQRDVLELVWSITAAPSSSDLVTAVGIPASMLSPFRRKALEWFTQYSTQIVEHLHKHSSGRARSGSHLGEQLAVPPSPGGSAAAASLILQKPSAYHCTWFGFLFDKLHPGDMAELESTFYSTLCRRRRDGHDGQALTLVEETQTAPPTPTHHADPQHSLARNGAQSALLQLCEISLNGISLRCLWRMLLFSLSRTSEVLLNRALDATSSATLTQDMEAVHSAWLLSAPQEPTAQPPCDGDTDSCAPCSGPAVITAFLDRRAAPNCPTTKCLQALAAELAQLFKPMTAEAEWLSLLSYCCMFLRQISPNWNGMWASSSSRAAASTDAVDLDSQIASGLRRIMFPPCKPQKSASDSPSLSARRQLGDQAAQDIAHCVAVFGCEMMVHIQRRASGDALGATVSHNQWLSGMSAMFGTVLVPSECLGDPEHS